MFNLFGAIPDILRGRKPLESLLGNAAAVTAAIAAPELLAGGNSGFGLLGGSPVTPDLLAEQAAAPVVDMGTQAGFGDVMNYHSGGLLGRAGDTLNQANNAVKPFATAMNAAGTAKSMFGQNQPAMLPAQPPQMRSVPLDLTSLLQHGEQLQQYDQQDQLRKRALMQQYINSIGGR